MATAQGTYKGQTIYAGDDAYISSQMKAIDSASTPTAPAPTMAPTTASSPSSFTLTPQAQQGLNYVQKSNPQLAQQIQGATTPQAQPVQQPTQTAQPSAQTTTQQVATTAQQPTNAPQTNLQPGAQGQQVNELQSMLQTLGYLTPPQIATGPGIYGPATTAAVAKLQKDLGVQTGGNEGFYGPKTREALKNKYRDAFGQLSGTAVPDSQGAARGAIDGFLDGQPGNQDKQRAYFEELFNMNPVESAIFQQLGDLFNPETQKQSLVEMMGQMTKEEGVLDLKLELADMKKIMDGTEDDIREEVTKAGGFATESQVKALSGARNKVLLREAQYLSDVIQAKEAYIDKIVNLTQADREQLDRDMDRKLGIGTMLMNMTQKMQDNARENYRNIIKDVGYDGLATLFKNDPMKLNGVEKMMGLPKGSLSDPEFLALMEDQKEWSAPYKLGGDYVQENLETGEVRVAVNMPVGGGGVGTSLSPEGMDYSSLIDLVANTGSSVYQQKSMREGLSQAINNGDWQTAYQFIVQGTKNSLTGENQTKFENAAIDDYVLRDLAGVIKQYQAAGGDMNIFKGSADDIAKRIGTAINDPRYTEIATQLDRAFQQYRQNMTGAAFGAAESAQYASVLPSKSRNLDLNLSIIEGALNYTNNYVTGSINGAIGPAGVSIKNKLSGGGSTAGSSLSDDDAYKLYLSMTK
jgi:hypothetical protein